MYPNQLLIEQIVREREAEIQKQLRAPRAERKRAAPGRVAAVLAGAGVIIRQSALHFYRSVVSAPGWHWPGRQAAPQEGD